MKNCLYTILFLPLCLGSLFGKGVDHPGADFPGSTMIQAQDTSCVGQEGSISWYFYNGIDRWELEYLYAHPFFPQAPDGSVELFSLETPYRFNEDFGSFASGFIKAPENGDYIFNITGNDQCSFYLSPGTDPDQKGLAAHVPVRTNTEEHYKYSEQTSDTFYLTAGDYYYFEIHHKEDGYTDFVNIWWKTPFYPDSVWTPVHGSFLYDNACFTTCPPKGTPCNDGDSTTVSDRTDGLCNCYGIPQTSNDCIGERGSITAMFYDTIYGNDLDAMYVDPDYPLEPHRALVLSELAIPVNEANIYGSLVRGYLSVPTSDNYVFNLTGDDQTKFFLSSGEEPDSLSEVMDIPGWTQHLEHYKYSSQTSDSLWLEQGQYYYFELHHKEGYGGDHASLFWRPSTRPDTNWIVLDGLYLYPYNCEVACIPEGTPCDDGNAQTSGDVYNDHCVCVGTPCQGPCEEQPDYTPVDFCSSTDQHSDNERDSWLSCTASASPNPIRGISHWIMYDFGEEYKIGGSKYWNYNVPGATEWGAKDVVIDYSSDGSDWNYLGTYTWPEASGDLEYSGQNFDALNGLITRYVLITIVTNRSDSSSGAGLPDCAGFSEIFFAVEHCEPAGTPCDDGDPFTLNDMFDHECNCIGLPLEENQCDTPALVLDNGSFRSGLYDAEISVKASRIGQLGSSVTLVAGDSIVLKPGFEVKAGAQFLATIVPCDTSAVPPVAASWTSDLPAADGDEYRDRPDNLILYPNPAADWVTVNFDILRPGKVSLYLIDLSGHLVSKLANDRFYEAGNYQKRLPAHKLTPAIYLLVLESPDGLYKERLVVID